MAMASDRPVNPLDDKRKAQEEEYFRQQNAEAAARMRAKMALEAAGVEDHVLRDELLAAGFDADKARALFILPLIDVAWADGRVQDEERKEILSFVEQRGIEKNSGAFRLVSGWLETKPTDRSYQRATELLAPIVTEIQKKNPDLKDWILKASTQVAEATGGLFGFGLKMTSKEEQAVIEKLAKKLS